MASSFNEEFRARTKKLALDIIRASNKLPKSDENRIIIKQLIRSATSSASNFRALCRARSEAEKFAKLSIVVEEADETLFWVEVITELYDTKYGDWSKIMDESLQIVKTMSSYRRTMKKTM